MTPERSAWIHDRLLEAQRNITDIADRYGRTRAPALLAVSKTFPVSDIQAAIAAGQTRFGESYVPEATEKIRQLDDISPEWHFIGPIQTNKTRAIAEHFDWVHGIERAIVARRLSEQRPQTLPDLQVCIQVNISAESTKAGVSLQDLPALVDAVGQLPRLRLRGLMAIPARHGDLRQQRAAFHTLREAFDRLNEAGLKLDTLSMGMTEDLEAAIAEGSTLVRLGTAIFGPRKQAGKT